MVGALEKLIGNSIFVSDGAIWRRQRAMIDPAFSRMRLSLAFTAMEGAVADYLERLTAAAAEQTPFSLDLAMSHLTADIICRTVFSISLQSNIAKDVFDDFAIFERNVGQVKIGRRLQRSGRRTMCLLHAPGSEAIWGLLSIPTSKTTRVATTTLQAMSLLHAMQKVGNHSRVKS